MFLTITLTDKVEAFMLGGSDEELQAYSTYYTEQDFIIIDLDGTASQLGTLKLAELKQLHASAQIAADVDKTDVRKTIRKTELGDKVWDLLTNCPEAGILLDVREAAAKQDIDLDDEVARFNESVESGKLHTEASKGKDEGNGAEKPKKAKRTGGKAVKLDQILVRTDLQPDTKDHPGKLPRQARVLIDAVKAGDEITLEDLLTQTTDELKTRQEPVNIFRFYRGKLIGTFFNVKPAEKIEEAQAA